MAIRHLQPTAATRPAQPLPEFDAALDRCSVARAGLHDAYACALQTLDAGAAAGQLQAAIEGVLKLAAAVDQAVDDALKVGCSWLRRRGVDARFAAPERGDAWGDHERALSRMDENAARAIDAALDARDRARELQDGGHAYLVRALATGEPAGRLRILLQRCAAAAIVIDNATGSLMRMLCRWLKRRGAAVRMPVQAAGQRQVA